MHEDGVGKMAWKMEDWSWMVLGGCARDVCVTCVRIRSYPYRIVYYPPLFIMWNCGYCRCSWT